MSIVLVVGYKVDNALKAAIRGTFGVRFPIHFLGDCGWKLRENLIDFYRIFVVIDPKVSLDTVLNILDQVKILILPRHTVSSYMVDIEDPASWGEYVEPFNAIKAKMGYAREETIGTAYSSNSIDIGNSILPIPFNKKVNILFNGFPNKCWILSAMLESGGYSTKHGELIYFHRNINWEELLKKSKLFILFVNNISDIIMQELFVLNAIIETYDIRIRVIIFEKIPNGKNKCTYDYAVTIAANESYTMFCDIVRSAWKSIC
jgi:hypothetical protein